MVFRFKFQLLIIIILALVSLIVISFIFQRKNLNFTASNAQEAKAQVINQVLRNEQGQPIISQDVFQQYLLVNQENYQIIYQKLDDTFMISINSSPFEDVRKEAEKHLLKLLQTKPEIACQLRVKIITPAFANPELAGQVFNLSFCK